MKSRMVEVAGLNLKITIHNNMLALSYNITGSVFTIQVVLFATQN